MATIQVIEEGPRNYIIKVDGAGVETAALIVDPAALNPPCARVRLRRVVYSLDVTAEMTLNWDDGTGTPPVLLNMHGGNDADMCFDHTMGLPPPPGANGKVTLSGADADVAYSIYLEFIKGYAPSLN